MFEEGNILDWNLSNFVSVGLIGATWLVLFSLGRRLVVKKSSAPNTATGAGTVVPFPPGMNTGMSLG